MTVAEFGERFFREIVNRDRKDTTIQRRYFDKSTVPAIGGKPVRGVTTEDVRAIIWRQEHERFDVVAGVSRGVPKRLVDDAMTAGLTATNPVMALPMRHVHRTRSRNPALAPQEIRMFLKAEMDSNVSRQFKVALRGQDIPAFTIHDRRRTASTLLRGER